MDEEVVLSKKMLKAISGQSRVNILKALVERQKTQSELAKELNLSNPTILEHTERLSSAQLIEISPDYVDKKWKYYRLTKTGRKIAEGQRMSIVLLLSYVSAALSVGLIFIYLSVPWIVSSLTGVPYKPAPPPAPPVNVTPGSGGQIIHAMSDLGSTATALIATFAMILLILAIILFVVAQIQKLRSR
jgi:DNA-binding HxlR family transcriptional regulator